MQDLHDVFRDVLGKAIDVMTAGPLAQSIFDYFSGPGYGRFGVDNVIYNRMIYNSGGGLHPYSVPPGGSPHYDHVHVDFFDQGGLARGAGFLPKKTLKPERMLSPRQTEDFGRLVDLLEAYGVPAGDGITRADVERLIAALREVAPIYIPADEEDKWRQAAFELRAQRRGGVYAA